MKAWLFNPENDIALGHGSANFTPPKMAQALHRAGALLPVWMASADDIVIAADADMEWVDRVPRGLFGRTAKVASSIAGEKVDALCPWGWSAHALRQFSEAGAPELLMEAIGPRLDAMRSLSHRRISAEVMTRLEGTVGYPVPPIPFEATSAKGALAKIREYGGEAFVKSPWSSTGRGVFPTAGMSGAELERRIEGAIRHQGSVMVEKALKKRQEFAMLFCCGQGVCAHKGYSLFFNDAPQAYGGNLLKTDEEIVRHLASYVPEVALSNTAQQLSSILTELVGSHFEGWLGVDMMIYEEGGEWRVNPCVEVNLRTTMGVVAWLLRRDLLADGREGILRMTYGTEYVPDHDLKVVDKRIEGGTLNLVPPSEGFSMQLIVG